MSGSLQNFDQSIDSIANQAPKNSNSTGLHRLRLSIDIHSVKDQDFRGNIYARYSSISSLNVKQFKSAPPIAVTKPRVEEQFPNSYRNYSFDSASEALAERLQGDLEIELWHQDRLKKDILIGISKFNLSNLLKGKVQKTGQSFAKISDLYLPVDEVDEKRRALRKIAEIRVILILEDLGLVENLSKQDRQFGIKPSNEGQNNRDRGGENDEEDEDNENEYGMLPEKNEVFGDLEYKIIWELETWKKAEESKYKIMLKQKELEYLQQLSDDWKKREYEKEKIFKKSETNIIQLSKRMKDKSAELMKREQKIVLLEEELKTRINETSRQISNKEDEITILKRKLKDERGNNEKDKTATNIQIEQMKEEFNQLKKEYDKYKKEQQNSPIALVKNELKDKEIENKELKKELEKSQEICEQYKQYYEKFRGELLKQKKQYEILKDETNFKNNAEIESLRNEISELKQALAATQNDPAHSRNSTNPAVTAFNRRNHQFSDIPFSSASEMMQQQYTYGETQHQVTGSEQFEAYNWNNEAMGELENLIYQRDYMISQVGYSENDPFVLDLNAKIKALQR